LRGRESKTEVPVDVRGDEKGNVVSAEYDVTV
jgi:hypothetical protein